MNEIESIKVKSIETENTKTGNLTAENAGTENGGDGGRTHRVGTITCGCMFVLYGVLFLLHTVLPQLNYRILFDLWPVILISLGVEILAGCTRKNQESGRIVYDFPAVLLVMFLTVFAVIMAAINYGMNISYYGV